ETTSLLSINVSEDLHHLLSTEVSTVKTPVINSDSDSAPSEERRKQLNRDRQKCFRDNNKETTSHLSIDVSEELQYLLNTKVPTVVVKTPAIDTESDSDDLSPLLTTEVPTITNLELTNTQSNPSSCRDKTKRHDMAKFWMIEKDQNSGYAAPKFSFCCTSGKVYHLIRSLLPNEGLIPTFAQLYIYDTANEITNQFTEYARYLQPVHPKFSAHEKSHTRQYIRRYNTPTASDVAAIIVDDGHEVNSTIALCEDILYRAHVQLQNLDDTNDIPAVIEYEALTQLENILLLSGKSLNDFFDMPIPSITSIISNNEET
ncbi:14782_t:CDS:2, partial [Racocetra fulgida]